MRSSMGSELDRVAISPARYLLSLSFDIAELRVITFNRKYLLPAPIGQSFQKRR
ncbi:hypothetical protein ALC53_04209 [Atta colombica]|uniref:Uncharacterized protein n=1 Tax=Atta colombica TaxID=520822 RepID=A0A195BL39_9HYME|nr:hypothetical protein ALC53_04209 [Atta colombica]